MNDTYWKAIWFDGSNGKVIAAIPGLAQATCKTRDAAIDAIVVQLGNRVISIDRTAGKLLLRK